MANPNLYNESEETLFQHFHSTPNGLPTSVIIERRRKQPITVKRKNRLFGEMRLLTRQFTNPLQALLLFAVILSFFLGDPTDAVIILVILLIAGILSYWQESNAEKAMQKIRQLIAVKHTVLRDGITSQEDAKQLMTGDILLLDAGDLIPADCRILESNELHVNESSITGESFPVEKYPDMPDPLVPLLQRANCLWQGTNVISGTAKAIVIQIGSETFLGRMIEQLSETTDSAFQKGMRRFGLFLLRITIFLSVFILLFKLFFQESIFDAVLFSLALAVGMAPELLPAIMTFSMAAGARMMMKKKVIIKKLPSVFNLGEVAVLCTDKTGTITEGKIRVAGLIDCEGRPSKAMEIFAYLNASLQNGFNNPIDTAIRELNSPLESYEKINEVPYDFTRKRLSVAVKKDKESLMITKGAFHNIVTICSKIKSPDGMIRVKTPADASALDGIMKEKSKEGYRVLGLAIKEIQKAKISKEDETEMIFLGFILLEDPLKESALHSIQLLNELQIEVKIITGDNRYAAYHAAQALGLHEPLILTGEEMDQLSTDALSVKSRQTHVFAEIEPLQKERIIKAIQQTGVTVGFIGDGINDVGAIHAADIGISTDNAVDAAKEASDFVLMEKDLSVLADGVMEGRKSFANAMKYLLITTGATFGNMFSVAAASLVLPFLPMLPKQLLLNNLITDLPFLSIYSDKVDASQLKHPGKWDLHEMRHFMWVFGLHSSVFDILTFYYLYFKWKLPEATFQTGWFLESAITEILILYVIRTRLPIWKSKPSKGLIIIGLGSILLILALPYLPFAERLSLTHLRSEQLFTIVGLLLIYMFSAEALKHFFYLWIFNRKKSAPNRK